MRRVRTPEISGISSRKDLGLAAVDSVQEHYLDQLRLVSFGALEALYRCNPAEVPSAQTMSIRDTLVAFVAAQREKWNDPYTFSSKLSGTAGGDGDWARDSLAFGFHVENTYSSIYRIWSRPWLVTK